MKGRENMVLFNNINLSEEQKLFVTKALEGKNILVDACIGSGKTTVIQQLCNVAPEIPQNYYPNDDPTQAPRVSWRSHAHLIYANWLNYFVYQSTPYDLSELEKQVAEARIMPHH